MPTVVSGGAALACQQVGAGPDVVLVHGLGGNRASWRGLMALGLERQFRVTLYDLRGHGYSDVPESGYSPAAMAGDLGAVLDALDCARVLIVAHSYGGQVALQFASRQPERVAGLMLLDSRVNCLQPALRLRDSDYLSPTERSLIDLTGDAAGWEGADDIGVRFLEEAARRQESLSVDEAADEDHFPFGGARGGRRMAQRWLRVLEQTRARAEFAAIEPDAGALARVTMPALLVYGERSRCLPSMRGLERALPQARSVVVPRAGHFFPVTRPRVVGTLLARFAGRLRRRGVF